MTPAAVDMLRATLRGVSRRKKTVLWSMLALVVALLVYRSMGTAFVEIEIRTPNATGISVYWAGPGENYSERRVTHKRIYPHKRHYTLLVGDLDRIERLRFDPRTSPGQVTIGEFSIYEYGYEPIRLRGAHALSRLAPFRKIDDWNTSSGRLVVSATNADPQLQLILDDLPARSEGRFLGFLWRTLGIVFLCVLFVRSLKWLSRDYQFVPYAMLGAFVLVLVMAATSRINAHPDEYVHILAARYYIDHNAPPAACADDTLHTYSPYGYSRLNSLEIAYYLTGKYANALGFLPIPETFRLRYYNVTLFAILLLLSVRSVAFRMVCLPVIASPQVWYIFSYVNSDATALFAALIAMHQIVTPGSWLRQSLTTPPERRRFAWLAALGIIMALLLLIKKNFYVAGLFVGLWTAAFFFMETDRRPWGYLRRLAPAVLVALVLAGWWLYEHESANDFQRTERIEQCSDRVAKASYRRDAAPEHLQSTLYWKDRGIPFSALFEHKWGTKVFYSAFGHFGYLELLGPKPYYQLVAVLLLILFVVLVHDIGRGGRPLARTTLGLGIAMFLLIVALTMWKAWTKDFQPQGRYFFPMIPITGFVLAMTRAHLRPRVISAIFLAMFLLSTYYFVFVGLDGIRKY